MFRDYFIASSDSITNIASSLGLVDGDEHATVFALSGINSLAIIAEAPYVSSEPGIDNSRALKYAPTELYLWVSTTCLMVMRMLRRTSELPLRATI